MVLTKVHFNNPLDRSEALEEFARTKVEHALDRFDETIEGTIHLQMVSAAGKSKPHSFRCEIELQSREFKKIVMKKAGSNLYQTITRAASALRSLALRLHERRAVQKRSRTSVKSAVGDFPYVNWKSSPG